tara:strand:+ start:994 stop:1239 length:246 start_codon:yes stop_codon:yes gene_type:complete
MAKLTQADIKWIDRVQRALRAQPKKSKVAFFTIGDNDLQAYDVTRYDEIVDSGDFGPSATSIGADFGDSLWFKYPVESTAG